MKAFISFMKNFCYVLSVILLIAVVVGLVYIWTRKQMSAIAERLLVVQREIQIELENLQLTRALKNYLDRRIRLIFIGIKIFFCLILSPIWFLLFQSGHDLLNSMFDAFTLVGILYASTSYLLFNKLTETNTLVTIIKHHLQIWVYRNSNFDPKRIAHIEYRIVQKENEAEQLRTKLKSQLYHS